MAEQTYRIRTSDGVNGAVFDRCRIIGGNDGQLLIGSFRTNDITYRSGPWIGGRIEWVEEFVARSQIESIQKLD